MDIIKQLLTEIKEGKKSFKPVSDSQSDIEDFQSVAKIMIYADQQGLVKFTQCASRKQDGKSLV